MRAIITIDLDTTGPDAWSFQCTCGDYSIGYANEAIARVHAQRHADTAHRLAADAAVIDVIDSRRV